MNATTITRYPSFAHTSPRRACTGLSKEGYVTTVDISIRGADRLDSFYLSNGLFGPATTAFHTLIKACGNGFAVGEWSYSHADVIVTDRVVRAILTGIEPLKPPYHRDEDNDRLFIFRDGIRVDAEYLVKAVEC